MNLDGPRQYTWRVTADLVVSRTRGAALFQSQANLISVALLDCNNWGANWRAEWRSYHPLFMCWVFFQGLCKGVLRFSINYRSSKVKRSNLKLHCWKETAAEQIKILNKTTTPQHLVSPAEYLKGVLSRSTYIHILSFLLVLFIHITQQINMSIYYIYMIYHPYFVKPSRFLYQYYDQFFIETENLLFFLFCWFGGTWYFSSTASTFRVLRKR